MMLDLIEHEADGEPRQTVVDTELLMQRAAQIYLETSDETGRPVRMSKLVKLVVLRYPEYDESLVQRILGDQEFDLYLAARRREHLLHKTAARLLAAEMGARVGTMALEVLQDRLDNNPDEIRTKDLIEIAKLGTELNAKIDRGMEQLDKPNEVTVNLGDVLAALPPERAASFLNEYARTLTAKRRKAELKDAAHETDER